MNDGLDLAGASENGGLKSYSLGNFAKGRGITLDSMKIDELLALRDEIDAKLPKTSIKDINIEREVLLHFMRLKDLQATISQDDGVPANQRAQIANSVANLLKEMVKTRGDLYNSEQCRMMEAALAKALKTLPEEAQTVFYDAYGRSADELATADPVELA